MPRAQEVRKLAAWEHMMIYSELAAARFVSMEKAKNKTARLMGPPPMPRKDDKRPIAAPMAAQGSGERTW